MPNIATWWCGQEAERAHVRANAYRMMIGSALSTRMPFDPEDSTTLGSNLQNAPGGVVDTLLDAEAPLLVGQETVTLSTTPSHIDGKLTPRPMSLRVFLARTSRGWRVMPGGYGRIGRSADASAIALQRGGSVSDVWVVSNRPVRNETMLPSPASPYVRTQIGTLPSRAADNLFWMGRYVERAEGLIRLLRSINVRLAEAGRSDTDLLDYAARFPGFADFDPLKGIPSDLFQALASATASASVVRDRFSVDGWTALNELSASATRSLSSVRPGMHLRGRWARCCDRSRGSRASCMTTCTGSPAGASCRSADHWSAQAPWRNCWRGSPHPKRRKARLILSWKLATARFPIGGFMPLRRRGQQLSICWRAMRITPARSTISWPISRAR